jgi:hypothetical protein
MARPGRGSRRPCVPVHFSTPSQRAEAGALACAGYVFWSARRYPPSSTVITGQVRLICPRCSAVAGITAGLTAAQTRSLAALGTGSVASRRCGADAEGALDGSWPTRTMAEREPSPVHEDHVVTDILASAAPRLSGSAPAARRWPAGAVSASGSVGEGRRGGGASGPAGPP